MVSQRTEIRDSFYFTVVTSLAMGPYALAARKGADNALPGINLLDCLEPTPRGNCHSEDSTLDEESV